MHLLVFLHSEDRFSIPEQIDEIISAELPSNIDDPTRDLQEIIGSPIVYGPYGPNHLHSPCIINSSSTSAKKNLRYNSPYGVTTIFCPIHVVCATNIIPTSCFSFAFPTATHLSLQLMPCTCASYLAHIPISTTSHLSLYAFTSPITYLSRLFFSPPHSSI